MTATRIRHTGLLVLGVVMACLLGQLAAVSSAQAEDASALLPPAAAGERAVRTAPVNDDFDTALGFLRTPTGDTRDIAGATTAGDDPGLPCAGNLPKHRTVWYDYKAAGDQTVIVDTIGSSYDTVLAVWTGSRGALTNVACNDDAPGVTQSRVQFASTPGTTYRIEVADFHNPSSTSSLTVTLTTLGPGGFGRTAPADGATGVALNPATLSWGASAGATGYEVCLDTSNDDLCNGGWTSVGPATTATVGPLASNTPYNWQVRALDASGITYANGGGDWWVFTTGTAPAAFGKTAPANGWTGVALNPTLSWGASAGATGYEVCLDTSNDNACGDAWVSTGPVTFATPTTLPPNTTHYWQVRAINGFGTTYADGGTWWSFTTTGTAPGAFGKTAPANGATGVALNPTLSWGASAGATSYEYCYDTSNDDSCWTLVPTGTTTSANLTGLAPSTTYYWQVWADNDFSNNWADAGTWWSFTTASAPPANDDFGTPIVVGAVPYTNTQDISGATSAGDDPALPCSSNLPRNRTVWYRYTAPSTHTLIIDTSGSSYDTVLAVWTGSRGALTNVACNDDAAVGVLQSQVQVATTAGTTYHIEVADYFNPSTTSSLTLNLTAPAPGAFGKTAPANGATGLPSNPTLSWGASAGASSYEYCYDTSNNGVCDGSWTSTGTTTSANPTGLAASTAHYWQVRAINGFGTTYADGGTWWSFTTTGVAPAGFGKTAPANGATGQPANPTLSWGASAGASSYEYCYDTSNNGVCDGSWTSTGTTTSANPTGLAASTAHYWQVRAINGFGTTYADGGTWWSFTTTGVAPPAFGKTAPANGATGLSSNPTLSWGASAGASSYEYCYDTSNNGVCDGSWTSTGTTTSANPTGLAASTAHYWQVRAINGFGTTYADGGTWWSFTTTGVAPAGFGKTAPANGATGQPANPTLSWGASAGASSYEYCYDTTNDNNVCNARLGEHRHHQQRQPHRLGAQHLLLAGAGHQRLRHYLRRRRHLVVVHHAAEGPPPGRSARPRRRTGPPASRRTRPCRGARRRGRPLTSTATTRRTTTTAIPVG